MIRQLGILTLVAWSSLNGFGQKTEEEREWSLTGYVKDMLTVTKFKITQPILIDSLYADNLVHNRLNFHWFPNNQWSVRLEMRNRWMVGGSVSESLNIDTSNDYFDLSYNYQTDDQILNTAIDRAYLQYNGDDWELRAGRQRINWGVNVAWNPNDIFNAYSLVDFDYEERPGADAIRFQKYIGYAGGYELAVKFNHQWDEITAAGMYKWNLSGYDLQVIGGYMNGNLVTGGGWAGNIGLGGFKGELSYFHPVDNDDEHGLLASVTLDYSFPSSFYLNGSVLYSSYGDKEFGAIGFVQTTAASDVRNISTTRWSTFLQAAYTLHPLVSTGLMTLYFPGSHVVYLVPTATFSPLTNLDIDLVGQLLFGLESINISVLNLRVKYSF